MAVILKKDKIKLVIREWVEAFVIAFIIAMVIRTFVVEPFKIPTGSMEPTLHGDNRNGDRIFVNKFIYWFKEMKRGDIIVFKTKNIKELDGKKNFIKRLIGLPGETLEIRNGDIFINGKEITDPVIKDIEYINTPEFAPYGVPGKKIEIPADSYFVLGDNSANSKDSRFWGFVPKKNIKGKAFIKFWPPHRMGLLK